MKEVELRFTNRSQIEKEIESHYFSNIKKLLIHNSTYNLSPPNHDGGHDLVVVLSIKGVKLLVKKK